jgi:GNAT superfamily N-acetyltransferase
MDIRPMQTGDIGAVARLMIEMEHHYGLTTPPHETVTRGLSTLPAGVEILLALDGKRPIGHASYGTLYPGVGLVPVLYLKDLYVRPEARGLGTGRRLMAALAQLAVSRGCQRIDWSTSRSNHAARSLYEAIGAQAQEDKVGYRLEGTAMMALAATSKR